MRPCAASLNLTKGSSTQPGAVWESTFRQSWIHKRQRHSIRLSLLSPPKRRHGASRPLGGAAPRHRLQPSATLKVPVFGSKASALWRDRWLSRRSPTLAADGCNRPYMGKRTHAQAKLGRPPPAVRRHNATQCLGDSPGARLAARDQQVVRAHVTNSRAHSPCFATVRAPLT